jgi:hypothetical protein
MKRLPLVLVAVVCVVLAGAAPASAGNHAPAVVDTWISGPSGRAGEGVLSANAQGQILNVSADAPTTIVFDVGANVSGSPATFRFMGGGGSPDFRVQYLAPNGADITLAVTGRGYTVRKVPAGGTATIRMVATIMPSAAGHSGNLAVQAGSDMVSAFVTAG